MSGLPGIFREQAAADSFHLFPILFKQCPEKMDRFFHRLFLQERIFSRNNTGDAFFSQTAFQQPSLMMGPVKHRYIAKASVSFPSRREPLGVHHVHPAGHLVDFFGNVNRFLQIARGSNKARLFAGITQRF